MTDQPTWPTPEQNPVTPNPVQPEPVTSGPVTPQPPTFEQSVPAPQPLPVQPLGSLVPQTSGNAIIALVLAIASWIVCPIVLAIVALVIASRADREIAAAPLQLTGGGLTTAAKIVAWVNIGVAIAFAVIGIAVIAVIAVYSSVN